MSGGDIELDAGVNNERRDPWTESNIYEFEYTAAALCAVNIDYIHSCGQDLKTRMLGGLGERCKSTESIGSWWKPVIQMIVLSMLAL